MPIGLKGHKDPSFFLAFTEVPVNLTNNERN